MIIIHRNSSDKKGESLFRSALGCVPVSGVILDGLYEYGDLKRDSKLQLSAKADSGETFCAVPEEWEIEALRYEQQGRMTGSRLYHAKQNILRYKNDINIPLRHLHRAEPKSSTSSWFVVSNGRYVTHIDSNLLNRVLAKIKADIVAVNSEPGFLGQREKVRLTTEGNVAGFRRAYSDSAEFVFVPDQWPHHIFIRTSVINRALKDSALSLSFSDFLEICRSRGLSFRAVKVGGNMLDLETEDGLISFYGTVLSRCKNLKFEYNNLNTISDNARLIGDVLLGENVRIEPNAVVIGPTIICNNARIEQGAFVHSSIVGPEVCISKNQFLQQKVNFGKQFDTKHPVRNTVNKGILQDSEMPFRTWSKFSYASLLKRIADVIFASIVLILFAPVMLLVAVAIKLTSPGPVFYKHKRQGLHGRQFNCLKFRTMILGADKIQEILRIVSQVDGPQFKIDNDPRINKVGWFLRETYIDEIPQFLNVLFGQMSIVGPRPSPESENTLCPFWRDARLSVRPGITGLWQVYRTREPMKDFQEWIYYDTEYVRNLSLNMDLSICWKTATKLLGNFIDQF